MTRLVLARVNHETNTFSPVKTPLSVFNPIFGAEALAAAEGHPTALGAFHAFAREIGAQIEVPIIAHANPSGPVEDAAFEVMVQAIVEAVAKGCDGILLDLHGAMVTRSHDDGEAALLARVRAAAPEVPIGVALDLHGNISQALLDNCDVIVGFKTYPHIDMVETGAHVTRLFAPLLSGGARPAMALNHPPMLAATLRMNTTTDCAMTDLIEMARQAETRHGVQAVTVFGGFPLADLKEAGLSILTVADTAELAQEVAAELAREAWARRAEYVYQEEPLARSVARAVELADGSAPILMLDHGDNCNSGGSCDVMDVLAALLEAGQSGIVVGPIADPQTVAQLFAAGEGAEVEVSLGNKMRAEGLPAPQPPLRLRGKVTALSDGRYRVTGPIYNGQMLSMGRAAAFDIGAAQIVICEDPHEPLDLGVFTSLGIDAMAARFWHLKSRMYCRPVFEPLAKATIECASSGVTGSDYDLFSFKKLARPIYPLDSEIEFTS